MGKINSTESQPSIPDLSIPEISLVSKQFAATCCNRTPWQGSMD